MSTIARPSQKISLLVSPSEMAATANTLSNDMDTSAIVIDRSACPKVRFGAAELPASESSDPAKASTARLSESALISLYKVQPRIKLLSDTNKRKPYPLSWKEQDNLFSLLPNHLSDMALSQSTQAAAMARFVICNGAGMFWCQH